MSSSNPDLQGWMNRYGFAQPRCFYCSCAHSPLFQAQRWSVVNPLHASVAPLGRTPCKQMAEPVWHLIKSREYHLKHKRLWDLFHDQLLVHYQPHLQPLFGQPGEHLQPLVLPPHQRLDRDLPPHQRLDWDLPPHQRLDGDFSPHQRLDWDLPPHQRLDRYLTPHQRLDWDLPLDTADRP